MGEELQVHNIAWPGKIKIPKSKQSTVNRALKNSGKPEGARVRVH